MQNILGKTIQREVIKSEMAEFYYVSFNFFFFNHDKHNYLNCRKMFIINTNNHLLTILNLLKLYVFYSVLQNATLAS